MTRLKILPGACGMEVTVEVSAVDKKTYTVTVQSECPMAVKLGKEIGSLSRMDAFKRQTENPVYVKGAACIQHAACPVPCGVLKALEVEAGLAVARDVTMVFFKGENG
ncbi:MAG: hypothetical protein M0024_02390 [Nitrospiraceae bacterium]|nr:hypothetical protein [Nitrospiraceae bacterium]